MNKIILKFVFLFTPLFERFGVNTHQLEIILQTKLTMDDRRPFAFTGHKQRKEGKKSSLGMMLYLGFMGLFLIYFLFKGQDTIFGNALYVSAFMILIVLTLVSDFSSVLIDVRDNFIILPRPVNDRTFTVSKILHITIHVFKLVTALTLPGVIAQGYLNGWAGMLIFMIEIQLATVFSIFLVNLLYLAVLKFSTPQRFNNMIAYFQIVFSLVVFMAYQILPRISSMYNINEIDPLNTPYSYAIPPIWFASFFDIIVHPAAFSMTKLYLGVTGVLMPFVSVWIVMKFLAPGFNKRLSSITPNGEEQPPSPVIAGKTAGRGIAEKLSVILSDNKVEQAGFKLTWWLTSRYRDFKVKVYPSFAFLPVYAVYMIFFGPGRRSGRRVDDIGKGSAYFFLIYSVVFVLITVLQQISRSEKYKAAWVMFSSSHNEPGKIISGMYKAVICKYFLPFYLVITVFTIIIWGPATINDLIFAFFNCMIFGIILSIYTVEYLPFSQPISNQGGKTFMNLLIMALVMLIGGAHFLVSRWEWAVSGLMAVSALICWRVFVHFRKRSWAALEADY